MEMIRLAMVAIIGALLAVLIKPHKPELAMLLSLVCAIGLMAFSLSLIIKMMGTINLLVAAAGINAQYFDIILRAVGITYLTRFACDVCRDAGESAIAAKVELAGKSLILIASLPLFLAAFKLLSALAAGGV